VYNYSPPQQVVLSSAVPVELFFVVQHDALPHVFCGAAPNNLVPRNFVRKKRAKIKK
jgi:hypothetical protein